METLKAVENLLKDGTCILVGPRGTYGVSWVWEGRNADVLVGMFVRAS